MDWRTRLYDRYPWLVGMFGLAPYRRRRRVIVWQSWYDVQDGKDLTL